MTTICPGWWRESTWVPLPGIFFSWECWCLALAGHKVSDSSLARSKFSSSKSSHSFPRSKHTVGICVDETAPQWVFETKADVFERGKPSAPIWLIPGWWIWLPPSLNPGIIPTKEHKHRFEKRTHKCKERQIKNEKIQRFSKGKTIPKHQYGDKYLDVMQQMFGHPPEGQHNLKRRKDRVWGAVQSREPTALILFFIFPPVLFFTIIVFSCQVHGLSVWCHWGFVGTLWIPW